MLVRNHAASSHRLWRPCSHRTGRHERKMPFMQYFFLCCGYVSYTKLCQRCNVARSNKFLLIYSHQDPLMIDWYREGLNLWTCLNPSLEPGWLGNWSHKDTATPQHWLFSRQGIVMSMLIPCRPTLCLVVPADLINNEKIEHKVTWQLMCMYIYSDRCIYAWLHDFIWYIMLCVCGMIICGKLSHGCFCQINIWRHLDSWKGALLLLQMPGSILKTWKISWFL